MLSFCLLKEYGKAEDLPVAHRKFYASCAAVTAKEKTVDFLS